jgi:hypothetical protein
MQRRKKTVWDIIKGEDDLEHLCGLHPGGRLQATQRDQVANTRRQVKRNVAIHNQPVEDEEDEVEEASDDGAEQKSDDAGEEQSSDSAEEESTDEVDVQQPGQFQAYAGSKRQQFDGVRQRLYTTAVNATVPAMQTVQNQYGGSIAQFPSRMPNNAYYRMPESASADTSRRGSTVSTGLQFRDPTQAVVPGSVMGGRAIAVLQQPSPILDPAFLALQKTTNAAESRAMPNNALDLNDPGRNMQGPFGGVGPAQPGTLYGQYQPPSSSLSGYQLYNPVMQPHQAFNPHAGRVTMPPMGVNGVNGVPNAHYPRRSGLPTSQRPTAIPCPQYFQQTSPASTPQPADTDPNHQLSYNGPPVHYGNRVFYGAPPGQH